MTFLMMSLMRLVTRQKVSEADDEDDGEVDGDNNQCTMEIQYNKDNTSDCESSDELDLDNSFFWQVTGYLCK